MICHKIFLITREGEIVSVFWKYEGVWLAGGVSKQDQKLEVWSYDPTSMTRIRTDFSDKNWVQIGLNWVRFHFLKTVKIRN